MGTRNGESGCVIHGWTSCVVGAVCGAGDTQRWISPYGIDNVVPKVEVIIDCACGVEDSTCCWFVEEL